MGLNQILALGQRWMAKRATILQVLEFFEKRDFLCALDLMEKFGYPRAGADWMLYFLNQRQLIAREGRGQYTITDQGMAKLIYLRGIR